jgi:hypothetical protein
MKAAADLSLKPGDDPGKGTADYNMIVSFAKLLDPNSVVREGEVQSASMTEGQIAQFKGWLNSWKEQGKLDDDVRRAIMDQSQNAIQAFYDQARTKRDWISGIAQRHGVNPDDVVSPLAAFEGYKAPEQTPPSNPKLDTAVDPPMLQDGKTVDKDKLVAGQTYKFDGGHSAKWTGTGWLPQ